MRMAGRLELGVFLTAFKGFLATFFLRRHPTISVLYAPTPTLKKPSLSSHQHNLAHCSAGLLPVSSAALSFWNRIRWEAICLLRVGSGLSLCAGKETTRTSEAVEAIEPQENDKWREVLLLLLEEPCANSSEVQRSRNDGGLDHFSSSIVMGSLDFDHSPEVLLMIR